MRAEAEAAALTSTSLRERWRELGAGGAAWVRVGGALAGGRAGLRLRLQVLPGVRGVLLLLEELPKAFFPGRGRLRGRE